MSRMVKIIIGVLLAIALVALCIVGVIVVGKLLGGPEEATPTAAQPPTSPPADSTATPSVDDSWDRVQAAGKIVTGTAADYAPFEFYTGELQIDGFDIALMDEIGRKLSVQIEYRDFAFDGLGGALQLKQIDAAIAAISVTPERESQMYFSNIYLVGSDGILAAADSNIGSIGSVDELAQYKVGVQRASVYESWIQDTLVSTGKMPASNLFSYEKAEDAIRDLVANRVGVVVLDLSPAELAVAEGSAKLVGQGLNQQRYAIALPQGAAALKAKIDEALLQLNNEGVIARLAKQYLGMSELLPTPTPAPTSTPAPPPECVDGMALVKHLTQEGDMSPGQTFVKGWQVKNVGTCTWTTGYKLVFVDGYKMGGEPVVIARDVPPGDAYDIQLKLVAPLKAGSYQSIWQMVNAQGTAFGERLKVNIRVVPGPTVTPAPTQTPSPGITFTVDRTHIKAGECVKFYWKVDNVKAVYFYQEGEDWRDNGVTGEETRTECPPVTTTYYLRVVNLDNSVQTSQITIYVEASPDAPYIARFTVDPPNQITLGQCVTVKWKVEGQTTSIKILANDAVLWAPAPAKGNIQDCPGNTGNVAYRIEAIGPGGTSYGQQNINVVDSATATPVPTAPPEQPAIYSFSVSPNQIQAGECVGVSWNVGGGTSYTRILRNGSVIDDNAGLTGQVMDCLADPGDYAYRLEAYNPAGDMDARDASVNVTDAAPSNPLAGTNWAATQMNGVAVIPGTSLTAAFGADGSLNGSAGCNTYSAGYFVNGSSLNIGAANLSGMMCAEPEGIMNQEANFLAAMGSAASFNMEGNQLYIMDGSGAAVLEFIRMDR